MSYFLLCLSLIIIPTINSFALTAFLPALAYPRSAQEFAAIVFILLIFISTRRHEIRPANRWLKALVVFIPVSIFCAPPLKLVFADQDIGGFWMWKAFFWCLAYFLLYWSILNITITDRRKVQIANIISWVAVLNSVYVFIQALGLDQWQAVRTVAEIGHPLVPHITGTIGNPTYCAIFLAACLPFIISLGCWAMALPVIVAVGLCRSDFGVVSAVLAGILPFLARKPLLMKVLAVTGALSFACFLAFIYKGGQPKMNGNGRFPVWQETIMDWKSPPVVQDVSPDMTQKDIDYVQFLNKRTYSLSGLGLGSFRYLFHVKHQSRFETAHNEYLEALYSIGAIGLFLFAMALWTLFSKGLSPARADRFTMACWCASFICAFCALGMPVFQYEPMRFFSAVYFSMLANLSLKK